MFIAVLKPFTLSHMIRTLFLLREGYLGSWQKLSSKSTHKFDMMAQYEDTRPKSKGKEKEKQQAKRTLTFLLRSGSRDLELHSTQHLPANPETK
jgi:hypothetical protein